MLLDIRIFWFVEYANPVPMVNVICPELAIVKDVVLVV
jgi:hypothetical protein